MRYFAVSLILSSLSLCTFAQTNTASDRLIKARADQVAWKPVTYKGDNKVSICASETNESKCKISTIPSSVGAVKGIVYDATNALPGSWLAFTDENIDLCVANNEISTCTFVGPRRVDDVKISYDTSTAYSSLIYLSKPNNHDAVSKVVKKLGESIDLAVSNIKNGDIQGQRIGCTDCISSPNLEDTEIAYTYYISAPFPAISVVEGAMQFIPIAISSGPELPDPLPDGVSPADILKARDPKGMAACTAAWYRVYITMTMDCAIWLPANYSAWSSCMRKSMDAYVINLKEDCYHNYYY